MPYNVLIVDDESMVRVGFESILRDADNYTIADSLDSAEAAVDYCGRHSVDLVLMDVVMSHGINGLEAARRIKERNGNVKVVIVTSMAEVSFLRKARACGVDSFWYKDLQKTPILTVLDRTMAGESIYPDTTPTLTIGNASSVDLTSKELEVLREIVSGATDQEIADKLFISAATVRYHIKSLMQKTGYRNRVELAVNACTEGLIVVD